jgi:mannosyl-3-phosphoglycerate phosphatase
LKKKIVFTDLDGTLLDYSTYSFQKALPALSALKQADIPLVICSSKTKTEIEYYRDRLENHHPFISENGGGIFIPMDYFDFTKDITGKASRLSFPHAKRVGNPSSTERFRTSRNDGAADKCGFADDCLRKFQIGSCNVTEEGDYRIIRLGAGYSALRKAIGELRAEGFPVRGFGDMTAEEVAALAGMSVEGAAMAKERDFDEPFILENGGRLTEDLSKAIREKGLAFTEGRFFHLLGRSDKGRAVSILIALYKRQFGDLTTLALGDGPNDVPMLREVDYPVIVQRPDGSYDGRIDIANLIRAEGIGPEGWNRTVKELILRF